MTNFIQLDVNNIKRWENLPEFSDHVSEITFDCDFDIFSINPIETPVSGVFLLIKFPYEGIRVFYDDREITSFVSRITAFVYRIGNLPFSIDENTDLTVIGFKSDYRVNGPFKLIDKETDISLTTIVPWDPARGWHPPQAYVNVDIERDSDPVRHGEFSGSKEWMDERVGTIWWDTSNLGYAPYYQRQRYSNNTEQVKTWGALADWSEVRIYQWVRSRHAPSSYNSVASMQEGDITIPPNQRAAGQIKQTLFFNGIPLNESLLHEDFWVIEGLPDFNDFFLFSDPGDSSSGPPYVEVYINGEYESTVLLNQFISDFQNSGKYTIRDHIHLKRSLIDLDNESEDYPWVQRQPDFISRSYYDENNEEQFEYFFWIEASSIAQYGKTMALAEIQNQLIKPTVPFYFFKGFSYCSDDLSKTERMTDVFIRNVGQFINDRQRYYIQFEIDGSRRDVLRQGGRTTPESFITQVRSYERGNQLYPKNDSWKLFRKEDDTLVPQALWIKLIESCVGFKYHDFVNGDLTPVPFPSFVEFDEVHGTVYRYGIGPNQIMAPSDMLIETVKRTILEPTFDTYPIDKNAFFETWFFDTTENIFNTLTFIYESFPLLSINKIFFNCLNDALAVNPKMKYIMKTSILAIHGIKLLESVG